MLVRGHSGTWVHLSDQEEAYCLRGHSQRTWFNENYPIDDMGRRAERNHRKKMIVGKSYKITYQDRSTVKTERIIDIRERNRKYITAYCHLRNAVRTFKRSRIKSIEAV